jgi:hypothetical protein
MVLLQEALVSSMVVIALLVTGFVIALAVFLFLYFLKDDRKLSEHDHLEQITEFRPPKNSLGAWLFIALLLILLLLVIYWLSGVSLG